MTSWSRQTARFKVQGSRFKVMVNGNTFRAKAPSAKQSEENKRSSRSNSRELSDCCMFAAHHFPPLRLWSAYNKLTRQPRSAFLTQLRDATASVPHVART